MSLTSAIHDSLPYIDAEPTPSQRAAAQDLINLELGIPPTCLHESIPDLLPSNLSPLMTLEMERLATSPTSKLAAIDLTRYESLSPPSPSSATPESWQAILTAAYTSQTYLSSRATSLSLLQVYGKNAWLVQNSQLEAILSGLELELLARKTEIENIVIERKNAQEAVGGEVRGLEDTWKRGVGRILETEVAAEGVRREILERRRQGAA